MKEKFLTVLLAGAMMLSSGTAVFANEKDDKIAQLEAQACIGVDNPGSFKINFYTYDGNLEKQSAVFEINV